MDEAQRTKEKDAAIENLETVLTMMAAAGCEPDAWERLCLLEAFRSFFNGLYDLAWTHVELAKTPTGSGRPVVKMTEDLREFSLARLQHLLEQARAEPVQLRRNFFGRPQ